MKTIGVVLMASSIIDKKSPRPRCRAEHRATDLRGRTRMKRSSLSLGRLDLCSYYFPQACEDRHFRKREVFFDALPQYRARLVRDVLSQDSDALFGCERREPLNERTRTRIASAHEVLVSLSLGGCQDYNKGQNIPRITEVTNAKAKRYQRIFARRATTSRSLSNASVAASSSKIRMVAVFAIGRRDWRQHDRKNTSRGTVHCGFLLMLFFSTSRRSIFHKRPLLSATCVRFLRR